MDPDSHNNHDTLHTLADTRINTISGEEVNRQVDERIKDSSDISLSEKPLRRYDLFMRKLKENQPGLYRMVNALGIPEHY